MGLFSRLKKTYKQAQNERRLDWLDEASEFLITDANVLFVAMTMVGKASRALREIETKARLLMKRPELLTYYRRALEAAQNLAEAYKEIGGIELAAAEELDDEEADGVYSSIGNVEGESV